MAMYKGPDGKMYYEEDIQCVIDSVNNRGGIYIGNLQASQNINTLKKLSIKGVLTAANGIYLDHPKSQIPHYLYVPAQDKSSFDISKYFDKAADWIHNTIKQTNILVHCLAGVSRSVSLVLGYLIKHHGMPYEQAYHKIKSRRKIIHPNDGFIQQLKQYEMKHRDGTRLQRSLTGISPNKRNYMHTISPKRHEHEFQRSYSPTKRYQYMYNGKPDRNKYIDPQIETKDTYSKLYPEKKQIPEQVSEKSYLLQSYSLRTRTASQHAPKQGNSRYNHDIKPSGALNDDLDKKIAQIRKKYQQYTDMHNPLKRSIARDTQNKYPPQRRGSFMQNYSAYNNQQNQQMKNIDVRLKKTQLDRNGYLGQHNVHAPLRGYTNQLRRMFSDRQY